MLEKLVTLRIFPNGKGKLSHSVEEINGELLLVPQFTLYGSCHKGRRPSFHLATSAKIAEQLFITFFEELCKQFARKSLQRCFLCRYECISCKLGTCNYFNGLSRAYNII